MTWFHMTVLRSDTAMLLFANGPAMRLAADRTIKG